jgi:hypothetical protein
MAEICNLCKQGYRVNTFSVPGNNYAAGSYNKVSIITVTVGNMVVQLPDTPKERNKMFSFKVLDPTITGNSATIVPPPGYTINSAATLVLIGNNRSITVVKDALNYFILIDAIAVAGSVISSGGVSTNNAAVRWDGITGTLIQDSGAIIDDSNNITGINDWTSETLNMGGLRSLGTSTTSNLLIGQNLSTPSGNRNLILGDTSGTTLTTGSDHIIIGNNISNTITTTNHTICIGHTAVANGGQSISIGEQTLSTGTGNILLNNGGLLGFLPPFTATGNDNVTSGAWGNGALLRSGNYNVAYGIGSILSSGDNNVCLGLSAGTDGYRNVIMGYGTVSGNDNVTCHTTNFLASGNENTALHGVNLNNTLGGTFIGGNQQLNEISDETTVIGGGLENVSGKIRIKTTMIGDRNVCESTENVIIGSENYVSDSDTIVASRGHNSIVIGRKNITRNDDSILIGSLCDLGDLKNNIIVLGYETGANILSSTIQIGFEGIAPTSNYHWIFHQMPQFDTAANAALSLNSGDYYINTTEFSTYLLCKVP